VEICGVYNTVDHDTCTTITSTATAATWPSSLLGFTRTKVQMLTLTRAWQVDHDMHHHYFDCNFAFPFVFMDLLHGTYVGTFCHCHFGLEQKKKIL
jgi:sterol desaturase/sphingolipid hydroxylase (fatty acid hydroxylase superfamily)